ncbi:MAG: LysM peptidoglycan-binding domain-containing protein [Bacteroidota bacterium]|nr:LysM peptidoglycan-binding domain-containing protein [Bacteroidota bacterium]
MKIFTALFFAVSLSAAAQKVEVPHKMDFAGITLIIRDDARREIQKDVDAFTASPRHYEIKAERARTYFPIIEKIFREEGVPDDFKYLVLQESALIPDAVSTSNAVGFWQFKDFTAVEMGLRVDRQIDERMNIAASTRAAARYLIKNNQFFDNWLFALQAYQMGAGGVMKTVEDTQAKATRMEITGKTYWYVKKFLAHKIAFEDGVKGTPKNQVVVFENRGHNTLQRLAKETMVDEEALRDLNKWTRSGVIPDDRTYVVVLPVEGSAPTLPVGLSETTASARVETAPAKATAVADRSLRGKINGVNTIQAVAGDDARHLAARAGVDLPKLLKWNDLEKGDAIIPGQVYFLGKKRLKGSEAFHKVSPGESLWQISQRYGLQLNRLKRYNRIAGELDPADGTMLFLASRRPKEDAVIANVTNAVEVNRQETFNWAVKTESAPEVITVQPVTTEFRETVVIDNSDAPSKPVDSVKILQTNRTTSTLEDTAAEVVPIPENRQHVVKAKETLYGIARQYNLTVMEIVEWNGLSLQEGIKPGQVLKLSNGEDLMARAADAKNQSSQAQDSIVHEVKTSDTLYSISRQYNVTIQEIMEWNEKKDFSLRTGEKLKILRDR